MVMGTIPGDNTSIPIMAHPPNVTSDLSLDEFLKTVIAKNNGSKGIKLDFKTTEALEKSKQILEQSRNNVRAAPIRVFLARLCEAATAISGPLERSLRLKDIF